MKNTVLVFTVNGAEQKIAAKCVQEVISNGDGTTTSRWDSGRTVITDRYNDGKWSHKKFFGSDGNLEFELTRVFDDKGNLISISENRADGGKTCSLYEYDDNNLPCYQKDEIMHADGSTKLYERWYRNFLAGEEFDKSKFTFEKEICYRKFDKNGHVVCFVDSCCEHENEYDESGNLISAVSKKNGVIKSKVIYYKSDDGMVEIQKAEDYDEKSIRYEIKDCRKSAENPQRISATYEFTKKM